MRSCIGADFDVQDFGIHLGTFGHVICVAGLAGSVDVRQWRDHAGMGCVLIRCLLIARVAKDTKITKSM